MLFIHIAADNCFGDDDDENDATDEVLLIGGHQLRYPLPRFFPSSNRSQKAYIPVTACSSRHCAGRDDDDGIDYSNGDGKDDGGEDDEV